MLLSVVKTASTPTTAAAMARPVSSGPRPGRAAAIGAAAARGAGAAAAAVGRAAATGAAAVARGAGAGAAAADGAVTAGAGPPAGPPGGKVGSLMVGAAEGLGGRLIRTVSFFGWTFPVSFLGGSAPLGTLGIFSAIKVQFRLKTKVALRQCQTLNPPQKRRSARLHEGAPTFLSARSCRQGCLPPGARLSPAAARPQGVKPQNPLAALRGRCCCGWGQPRSAPTEPTSMWALVRRLPAYARYADGRSSTADSKAAAKSRPPLGGILFAGLALAGTGRALSGLGSGLPGRAPTETYQTWARASPPAC